MKANSASVDTQKTWQLNFVLTNGKSNFNLPITGGIGTAVFTIGGIMIMAGAVMLYICDPQKQKIGSFRKKRKSSERKTDREKGRKTNRKKKTERKRVCLYARKRKKPKTAQ